MIRRGRPYLEVRTEAAAPESAQLEREGYAIVRGVLSPGELTQLRDEVAEVFAREPGDVRNGLPPEDREMFRYAMLNRSAAAQATVAHPRLLAVIEPLLGEDCHVIANTAWRNPAGQPGSHGGQNWHIDAGPHVPLPAGVIPYSHLSGRPPPAERRLDDDLTWEGRGVTPFIVKAGDAGLFVSDIWHRRMPTRDGDHGRFFLQVHYG